jgi:DNA polymerase-3 subunit beta
LQTTKTGLTITATDGFRLSRKVVEGLKVDELDKGLIIPARTTLEMVRVLNEGKKQEVIIRMLTDTNQVVMEYDGIELMSRVLEGNFPDVDKIIPQGFGTSLTVDRSELLRAVKAAGIFARESSNVIIFSLTDSVLTVKSSSAATGETKIEIEVEKEGEDGQIAFNYRYVLDFLNSVDAERVTFQMTESLAPGVFGVDGDKSLVHIIMPVRV